MSLGRVQQGEKGIHERLEATRLESLRLDRKHDRPAVSKRTYLIGKQIRGNITADESALLVVGHQRRQLEAILRKRR